MELRRSGEVSTRRDKRYFLSAEKKSHEAQGVLEMNQRGFGFIRQPSGRDIYVPEHALGKAVHGDRVRVKIQTTRQGPMGSVTEIVNRAFESVVGVVREEGDSFWLFPLGKRNLPAVRIDPDSIRNEKNASGKVATVKIDWEASDASLLSGKLLKILGDLEDESIDTDIIMAIHSLPTGFPSDVEDKTRQFPDEINIDEFANREDFRELPFVTIDGEDAKDFDDAICIDKTGQVWVAIADVAHFVRANSPIDQEALDRGNSYYFPDRAIPMLPHALSNRLCSLQPNTPRLAIAVKLQFSDDLDQVLAEPYEAVIESKARLTYTQVTSLIEGKPHPEISKPVQEMLQALHQKTQTLRQSRLRRGGIDFELGETKVILNEKQEVIDMQFRMQTQSQSIVEELMLATNWGISVFLEDRGYPVVWRNHEGPQSGKLEAARQFFQHYGVKCNLDAENPRYSDFRNLISKLKRYGDRAHVFHALILRSMSQAFYGVKNLGHYGLGFSHYAHFTSPIRRYSDLVLHRILKRHFEKSKIEIFPKSFGSLDNVCTQVSEKERLAMQAERDCEKLKSIRFLMKRKGEIHPGVITMVTQRGCFLELRDYSVEGFLPLRELPKDRYDFFEKELSLRGRRSGLRLRVGDPLLVEVGQASIEEWRSDFRFVSIDSDA